MHVAPLSCTGSLNLADTRSCCVSFSERSRIRSTSWLLMLLCFMEPWYHLGAPNPNCNDTIGFFDLPLGQLFGPQHLFELCVDDSQDLFCSRTLPWYYSCGCCLFLHLWICYMLASLFVSSFGCHCLFHFSFWSVIGHPCC